MSKSLTPFNVTLLFIAVGIVFSFTIYAETAYSIGFTVFSIVCVLFIHELGHVIGGRIAGYQFVYMTVGPLTIEKAPKLKIIPNHHWLTFGGVVNCIPPQERLKNIVERHKWFVAGGPVLTGITAIASFVGWYVTEYEFLLMFSVMNLAIFLATAVPFQGTFKSDGYVFLMLYKGGKEAETFLLELLLLKEMMSPKNPTHWDEQLICEAQSVEPSLNTISSAYILFYYNVATASFEEASSAVTGFKQLPLSKKTKMNLQFITHIRQIDVLLSEQPDGQLIQNLHKHLSKIEPISYKRSEAILAYCRGDVERAKHLLDEVMRKCVEGTAQYGFFEAEYQVTQLVKHRLERITLK